MKIKFLYTLIVILAAGLIGTTTTATILFVKLQTAQSNPVNQNIALVSNPVPTNENEQIYNPPVNPSQPLNTNQPANGLSNHDTWITFSSDPTHFPEGTLVEQGASVPDVLVCDPTTVSSACAANDLLIYFVNANAPKTAGQHIALIKSSDGGSTWSDPQQITLSNLPTKLMAVDPSLVLLADGTIRLYFFGSTITSGDPAQITGAHVIHSATSKDGVNFVLQDGERFSKNNMTDPDVTFWNGVWYMAYSVGPSAGMATSLDGLTFADQGTLSENVGGVPGLVATPEGLRAYGCQQGIQTAVSTDGKNFSQNATAVNRPNTLICDPSVEPYQNKYVMVYKAIEQTDPQP